MKTNEQQLETNVSHLRVFWGDEDDEAGNRRSPNANRRSRRQWAENEEFWAGRNRAGRLSARLVA